VLKTILEKKEKAQQKVDILKNIEERKNNPQ